jgi:hypothetical protein
MVDAVSDVAAANGELTSWVLNGQGEALVLRATDSMQRPLFISNLQSEGRTIGNLLGRPAYKSRHVTADDGTVGFAGDWPSAVYGMVEGISVTESSEATITDSDGTVLNLWQRNMFAIRAEVEIGFAVRDDARFVRLIEGGS